MNTKKQLLSLHKNGFIRQKFNLPHSLHELVKNENYQEIDDFFKKQTDKDGALFLFLKKFCDFKSIEFIISLRDAQNEWEEDGIWHDDGSRLLAFSLSIKDNFDTEGGVLEIKRRGESISEKIAPFGFGEIIIFKTANFEHKINAVTKGRRLIIAGWCS